MIFAYVSCTLHHSSWHRPFVNAQFDDHQKMQCHEADQHSWNYEYMQRKESGKRGPCDNWSTQHQLHDGRTGNGHAARDGGADSQSPVSILIEPKNLPAEGHAQRHQQKKYAENPGKFARKFVGPEEKHLNHVDKNDGHHKIRAPAVHSANEPAESYIVVQSLQTAPRFAGRRDINQGKQDPRRELQQKDGERRAAEDVPPARCVSWHGMLGNFANRSRELQATVKPLSDLS